jgi:8-oxo-dGTP pyrophosphatase MutT (NUDIX family)
MEDIEKSAGAIIFLGVKPRQYLLLHYEEGHWDLPKGNIEKGEEEKQTALREIEEETGITDISFITGFKEKIHYFYKRDCRLISKEVIFYLAETNEKEIKLSFEHIGFKWLPYKEALNQLTHKNAKELLKKAEQFL